MLLQPRHKRRSTPAERGIVRQSVGDILANLQAHPSRLTFPRSTTREIKQLLHLQRPRDLGMSAGEIVMAIERL
jgi:hypothetical protein